MAVGRLSPSLLHRRFQSCTSLAACKDLYLSVVEPLGFDTFACGEIDASDSRRVVFHIVAWPDAWRKLYIQSKMYERDPIVEAVVAAGMPITWTQLRRERRISRFGTEALQTLAAYGWSEGFAVPIFLAGTRVGLVSLAGKIDMADDVLEADLSLICQSLFWRARSLAQRQGFAVPPMGLTARELDVLNLVARGCSGRDVARACGISDDVAHEAVERARGKLGAKTRAEAVAVAAAFGILNL